MGLFQTDTYFASALIIIVLIFQDWFRKEIRIDQLDAQGIFVDDTCIGSTRYLSKKNIIEEKGETQKNILPIKKNIVPLHTF